MTGSTYWDPQTNIWQGCAAACVTCNKPPRPKTSPVKKRDSVACKLWHLMKRKALTSLKAMLLNKLLCKLNYWIKKRNYWYGSRKGMFCVLRHPMDAEIHSFTPGMKHYTRILSNWFQFITQISAADVQYHNDQVMCLLNTSGCLATLIILWF
jgi:hypothetical protein